MGATAFGRGSPAPAGSAGGLRPELVCRPSRHLPKGLLISLGLLIQKHVAA
jgi:hypothetical protein